MELLAIGVSVKIFLSVGLAQISLIPAAIFSTTSCIISAVLPEVLVLFVVTEDHGKSITTLLSDFHLDIIMRMTVVRRRLILSTTLAKETRPISKRVGVGLRALDTTPQVMARLRERIPERAKHSLSRPVQTIIISLLMTRGQGIMV